MLPCHPGDESLSILADDREERMKTQLKYVCPRCDHLLVPVHGVEGAKRKVIALTCPEPYCDHVQALPGEFADEFDELAEPRLLRRAN